MVGIPVCPLLRLNRERWTRAINKIKVEIYHWQGKMKQQEQNSHCFLSQPQLCAHTLLAHCHLSLSQALASSPTAPTRPGQRMPLPNIHLLPAGLRAHLKWACHRDPFRFLLRCVPGAQVNACYSVSYTRTKHTMHVIKCFV